MRPDVAAEHDAAAQRDDSRGLAQREIRIAPVMAAVDDLDSDRAGVDVFLAGPGRNAGMPGPLGLGHALHDPAVLQHDVVGGHLGSRRAETGDRALDVRHPRVVQQDHVGRAALVPLATIRRRDHVRGNRGIGGECLHVRVFPGRRERAVALRINSFGGKRHETLQNKRASNNTDSPDHYSFMTWLAQSHGTPLPQFCPGVCRVHHRLRAVRTRAAVGREIVQSHQRFLNAADRY